MTSLRTLVLLAIVITLVSACSESDSEEYADFALSGSTDNSTITFVSRNQRVAAAGDEVVPLLPGMTAPAFVLQTADGSEYSFDPATAKRPIVLTFYRGGFCPYCNRHLASMRHAEMELIEMGYDVLFVSMDKPEILRSNLDLEAVRYTLLSDASASLTRAFGLAYRLSDDTIARYMKSGIDLEEDSGYTHHILPTPATFVVGTDGVIDFSYVNPNIRERVNPELLVLAARLASEDQTD